MLFGNHKEKASNMVNYGKLADLLMQENIEHNNIFH